MSGNRALNGPAKVMGCITPEKRIRLYVDGILTDEKPIANLIERTPNDRLVIGADVESQILKTSLPPFKGTIRRVAVHRGLPGRRD